MAGAIPVIFKPHFNPSSIPFQSHFNRVEAGESLALDCPLGPAIAVSMRRKPGNAWNSRTSTPCKACGWAHRKFQVASSSA
jgi:hypothetical protein